MKIYYGNDYQLDDFKSLIFKYSYDEFLSPYRSTVNLLSFFQNDMFNDFLVATGVDESSREYHFEYQVPVQKGKGKSSHTDLMIIDHNKSIAIEAKYMEPEYEEVKTWLRPGNKTDVLNGWVELINMKMRSKIAINELQEIPYQMVHRLASACAHSEKQSEMIYLYFGKLQKLIDYYSKKINMLKQITNDSVKLQLFVINAEETSIMTELKSLWGNGQRDLFDKVTEGLAKNSLYENYIIEKK